MGDVMSIMTSQSVPVRKIDTCISRVNNIEKYIKWIIPFDNGIIQKGICLCNRSQRTLAILHKEQGIVSLAGL